MVQLTQLKAKPMELVQYMDSMVHKNIKSIKEWIYFEYQGLERAIYTSVDIRNAGFKVAPVDTNLFPAGFNNLDSVGIEKAKLEFSHFINQYYPKADKILLIPENFTRNSFYFRNIAAIARIFSLEGKEVLIGSPYSEEPLNIEGLLIHPIIRNQDNIELLSGWKPDLIVLNNDLTKNVPDILQGLHQPIVPSLEKGWYKRRKHNHFTAYDDIINRFSQEFALDPWLLSTYTHKCGQIDFKNRSGLECIASSVDKLIFEIKKKYDEYKIDTAPYVYVKADNGTFGIGVMSVQSGEDLLNINKKRRHSMDTIKEGVQNKEVVIQEGVPTIHNFGGVVAEKIAYLVNAKVVSMLVRKNSMQDRFSNLNTPDMTLEVLQEWTYGVEEMVAELAAIATLHEKEDEEELK